MSRVLHFSGVMMVPGFVDKQKDVATEYKIQREFYNADLSRFIVRVGHLGRSKAVKIVGQRLLSYPQMINGYLYPSGTWIVDMVTYEEKIIDLILNKTLIGLSIDGDGINLTLEQDRQLNEIYLSRDKKYLTFSDFESIGADWIVTGVSIVANPSVDTALLFNLHVEEVEDIDFTVSSPTFLSILKSEDVSQEIEISYEPKLSKVQLDNSDENPIIKENGGENMAENLTEKEVDSLLAKFKKFIFGGGAEVDNKGDEEPKDETPKDETPKDEEPKDETPKGEEPKDEEPKDEEPKDETPKDEEPKDEEPKDETPKDDEPKDETSKDEKPKDEEPKDEEPKDEEPKDEEPKDEEPKDEKPKVEVLKDSDLDLMAGTNSNIKKGELWLMDSNSESVNRKEEIKKLLNIK